MTKLYTVAEVADIYGVTTMGVRFWIKNGLKHHKEKIIGVKIRMVMDLKDVDEYLNLGTRKG